MAILLALLSAVAYGGSDFMAGIASRRIDVAQVATVTQLLGLITAAIALVWFHGSGAHGPALAWGALAGIGSAVGTFALYRGFAVGRMSTVATSSAVLTAVIPALVGVALGNQLAPAAAAGLILAIPAIALVSWHPGDGSQGGRRAARLGAAMGIVSGLGFALLFIALDRAGTRSGAWPMVSCEFVSLIPIMPLGVRSLHAVGAPPRATLRTVLIAGILSGGANLLYLAATGHGELAIVAVLGAMYPALTVILARVMLGEHWARLQAVGLLAAAMAVALVAV